jgi:hypothetical protein
MLGGRKITATLTGGTMEGSMANCCLQRAILLPLLCCLVVDEVIEAVYTLGYALSSSVENLQILSHRFFRWH